MVLGLIPGPTPDRGASPLRLSVGGPPVAELGGCGVTVTMFPFDCSKVVGVGDTDSVALVTGGVEGGCTCVMVGAAAVVEAGAAVVTASLVESAACT